MTNFKRWRKAVFGTLAAAGVWLAAVLCIQPPVTPTALPVAVQGQQELILTNDYTTAVKISGITYEITIYRGAASDGASVPDFLSKPLGLTRFSPCLIRGAFIHDALYRLIMPDGTGRTTKELADLIFWQAILDDGCIPAKADACYEAVRLYGFTALQGHTKESVAKASGMIYIQSVQ